VRAGECVSFGRTHFRPPTSHRSSSRTPQHALLLAPGSDAIFVSESKRAGERDVLDELNSFLARVLVRQGPSAPGSGALGPCRTNTRARNELSSSRTSRSPALLLSDTDVDSLYRKAKEQASETSLMNSTRF
jgi:hypothetical protein